jgi:hypothetical protein
MPTNLPLKSSPRRDTTEYSTHGEIVGGVIWLAFYLAILGVTIMSPMLSRGIEIAARY